MTDQPISRTEYPASVTVKFYSKGFACDLTLRAETGGDVLTRLDQALTWLTQHGAAPHGEPEKQPEPAPAHQAAPTLASGLPDPAWCSIHNCTMTRHEKDGQVWYSHKTDTGTYCRGGAK